MVDELKSLAKRAKCRLQNGFWTKEKEYRQTELNAANIEGRIPKLLPSNYNQFIKSVAERKVSYEEEQFLQKVRDIAYSETEVDNPLGRLIDYEYYNGLDYMQKQRYIFNLAERYRKALALLKTQL